LPNWKSNKVLSVAAILSQIKKFTIAERSEQVEKVQIAGLKAVLVITSAATKKLSGT
jgi:hypothetical protein